ncbi:MAG: hydantoinase B/oxoprolinase family protein [Chloroflexi bacterium]|nr:hydantoinase B/oxoprolinase family protein [Chloroflexota bacterium]
MQPAIHEPLEVEVFSHALRAVAEEMGATMIRTARSINIRERVDTSCAIFDREGRLLAQAEHHPNQLGALLSMIPCTLRRYPADEVREGDVFIGTAPDEGGGTHLPDVTVAAPVFCDGRLVGFVVCMGHWPDVGGKAPGASIEGSTEIYQEGLRISPIRIVDRGVVNANLLDLLLANTRTAATNRLDFQAQLAACAIGGRGVHEVIQRYGLPRYERLCADVLARTELTLRHALAALPPAEVAFEDTMDDDGFDDAPVRLRVTVRIRHEPAPHVVFDFSGSGPQRVGAVNSIKAGLYPSLVFVLKALLAPDLLVSAGAFRVFEVVAPEGSVVNCQPPAAVGAKGPLLERVVELCFGALAAVLPDRVIAASGGNTSYFFSWYDTAAHTWHIHLEGGPGGAGARPNGDGPDAIQVNTINLANMPVEITEHTVPVLIERWELLPDSGGAGRYRGGLGALKEYRLLKDMHVVPHGDRHRFPPWGLFGGQPGAPGRFGYVRDGVETRLPSKGEGHHLRAGDLVRIRTPGGGGDGDPRERDLQLVARDLGAGKLSPAAARELYGFAYGFAGGA